MTSTHIKQKVDQDPDQDTALVRARRRDTTRRRQQVHSALAQLRTEGAVITVSSVARSAGVHRSFIHRHRDLHAALHAAATRPTDPAPTNSVTSYASMKADLLNTRAQNARLRERVNALQARLSDDLGQAASRHSGLTASDDIPGLHHQLLDHEQQILELRRQLEERTEELTAARGASRELMTQLNSAPRR